MKNIKIGKALLLAVHDALIEDSLAWTDLMLETEDSEKKLKFIQHAEVIDKYINALDDILGIEADEIPVQEEKKEAAREINQTSIELEQEH
ncbi:MAG TPA: hypothetical protein VKM55_09610 [Candidatus Lokiarchaeia archaeon]|nr:hypothetical protein [Candidatus Lokiarchaeia archaeon]